MDSSTRRRRRAVSMFVAGVGASLLLSGCGFGMQTLQPYTPAHGVNVDVAAGEQGRQLKVRNLLVVSDTEGQGIVSGSIVSPVADRLVSIEGVAHKADNTLGAPLTVSGSPVELAPNRMAVLTEGETFSVSSPDLQPGLVVDLTLTFESGASATAKAPVMSYDDPIYGSISPSPAASAAPSAAPTASVSATPAPSATPTP